MKQKTPYPTELMLNHLAIVERLLRLAKNATRTGDLEKVLDDKTLATMALRIRKIRLHLKSTGGA